MVVGCVMFVLVLFIGVELLVLVLVKWYENSDLLLLIWLLIVFV